MFGKISKWMRCVAAALCLIAALAPAALADGPDGSGPNKALTPSGEWKQLTAGGAHWYIFQTPGADSDGNVARVTVEVQVAPVDSVRFSVWTDEELRRKATAAEDETVEPIGRGSAEPLDDLGIVQKLVWAGGFTMPGPYFVCIEPTGTRISGYVIKISGDKVSFPAQPATQPKATAQPKAVAPQVAERAIVSAPPAAPKAVSGPDDALTAAGDWKALGKDRGHWYAFRIPGADTDGNASQITIEMQSAPPDNASFSVWTPEGLHLWKTGVADEATLPVGRSSSLELDDVGTVQKSVWSGQFNIGGVYYVYVQNTGVQPAYYALQVMVK